MMTLPVIGRQPRPTVAGLCLAAVALSLATPAAAQDPAQSGSAARIESGTIPIHPETTSIEFTGTHVGDDPLPRLGGFTNFQGTLEVDEAAGSIKSIVVEFDMHSIWTEFDKLTTHLKNADFLEVEKFPEARFVSTSIEPDGEHTVKITGELTLHGTTREISFPGKYEIDGGHLVLDCRFTIDRTRFGMDQMTSGVEAVVSLEVIVGKPNNPRTSQDGNGSKKRTKDPVDKSLPDTTLVSLYLPHMT